MPIVNVIHLCIIMRYLACRLILTINIACMFLYMSSVCARVNCVHVHSFYVCIFCVSVCPFFVCFYFLCHGEVSTMHVLPAVKYHTKG